MRKIILLLALLSTGASASPDPYDIIFIDVHLASKHTVSQFEAEGKEYTLNEKNFGLGMTFPVYDHQTGNAKPDVSYRFGFYENSYSDTSIYGGIDWHTPYTNGLGVGMVFGVVTGYQNSPNEAKAVGAILPHVQYIYNSYKAEVALLYSKYAPALTLTISYKY